MATAEYVESAVSNEAIAERLATLADLLEIKGQNPFQVRAYRNAAIGLLNNQSPPLAFDHKPADIPPIGIEIRHKIDEIVRTGKLKALEELQHEVPLELLALRDIGGLGPNRIRTLYRELGIRTCDDLLRAARSGQIALLRGFGDAIQDRVLRDLQPRLIPTQGMRRDLAEAAALPLLRYLRMQREVQVARLAGDYRRGCATVKRLEIVAASDNALTTLRAFMRYPLCRRVLSSSSTRADIVLTSGAEVILHVSSPHQCGAALAYHTGAPGHNIRLRNIALARGLQLSERGVFRDGQAVAGRNEHDVYRALGLPWIAPELREDDGEIEAARHNTLPELVNVPAIRGDLHVHTQYTDGLDGLQTMVQGARDRGYEYVAVTDHSKNWRAAAGLSQETLLRQLEKIDRLNEQPTPVHILKAIEVDILADGSLDLPDFILQRLDLVVGAVHDHLDLSRAQQTERLIRAMDNPYFNILAHPTGRVLSQRNGYAMDLEAVMQAARERGCVLEINAQPGRLDLNDRACRLARQLGVKLALCTAARCVADLDAMRFGITQARRGWLRADDIINTRNLRALKKCLQRP